MGSNDFHFRMTSSQVQAFSDASGGVTPHEYNHLILLFIGVFATIWLVAFFVGISKALGRHQIDVAEALVKFCIALVIYIAVGCMIF